MVNPALLMPVLNLLRANMSLHWTETVENDPADIPKLIEAIKDADLVCGIRVNRKDPFSKKITSFFANRIRRKICDDGVTDTGCSLKIYRATALRKIKMYNGMHRFLPALFKIEGLRIREVPVNHRERTKRIYQV